MMQHLQPETRQWLAPVTSELLVAVDPKTGPMIMEVAPQCAAWMGRSPQQLVGLPLAEVFDPIIPGLPIVVEEVCHTGMPVRDYRVTFRDAAGREHIVLVQASRTAQQAPQRHCLVTLHLQEVSVQDHTVATEDVQTFHGMCGRSPALLKVFRKIELYGPTEAPVLITGETGTGKDLAARALHTCSQRRQQSFVAVHCAALVEELLESELFGHEKGAFTGAMRTHKGRFERAHGGTLFLDEVGEMPLRTQVKLLRVLEAGVIERVGGEREIMVDVRLVAATNVPLELAVQARTFRADLYHRLAVLRVHMPPLRERRDDIPLLVAYFLKMLNRRYRRNVRRVAPEALALLAEYPWPGNIRELRNVLERAYVETTSSVIELAAFEEWAYEQSQHFPGHWQNPASQNPSMSRPIAVSPYPMMYRALPPRTVSEATPTIDIDPSAITHLDSAPPEQRPPPLLTGPRAPRVLTRQRIVQAYNQAAGNLAEAARLLGVHRATLYRRMQALGITRDDLARLTDPLPSTRTHARDGTAAREEERDTHAS